MQFSTTQVLTASTPGITQFTDGLSKNTQYYYDGSDRITKTITPNGNTATATYNATNDVTASVSPNDSARHRRRRRRPDRPATYTGDNLTRLVTATQAIQRLYVGDLERLLGGSETNLPECLRRSAGVPASLVSGGTLPRISKHCRRAHRQLQRGGATATVRRQGGTVCRLGPTGAAAYAGAVCETRAPTTPAPSPPAPGLTARQSGRAHLAQPGATRRNGPTAPPAVTDTYDGRSRLGPSPFRRQNHHLHLRHPRPHPRITYNDGTYTTYTYDDDEDQLTAIDGGASYKFSAAARRSLPQVNN